MIAARQIFLGRGARKAPVYLDWIANDGNSYIKTPLVLAEDYYAFEAEFGHTTTLNSQYYDGVVFGCAGFPSSQYTNITTGASHFCFTMSSGNSDRMFWSTNGRSWWGWNGSNVVTKATFCNDTPTIRNVKLGNTSSARPTYFYIDSVSKRWDGGDLGFVFPTGQYLSILGMSFSDGVVRPCATGMFFRSLRIYNASGDVCNFHAAKLGGEIGVYDSVSGKFTVGTGNFTSGNELGN